MDQAVGVPDVSNKNTMTKSSRHAGEAASSRAIWKRSATKDLATAGTEESVLLEEQAKREIAGKRLRSADAFTNSAWPSHDTQAKGAFKIMEDDVSDALESGFCSARKRGQTRAEDTGGNVFDLRAGQKISR